VGLGSCDCKFFINLFVSHGSLPRFRFSLSHSHSSHSPCPASSVYLYLADIQARPRSITRFLAVQLPSYQQVGHGHYDLASCIYLTGLLLYITRPNLYSDITTLRLVSRHSAFFLHIYHFGSGTQMYMYICFIFHACWILLIDRLAVCCTTLLDALLTLQLH
jgi:hypothetical protein